MTFLPARMRRLLVGGHNSRLEAVIGTLHEAGAVHIEDYRDPTGTTRIGTPLEAGERASELLVRLRGLQKSIGASAAPGAIAAGHSPEQTLADAEKACAAAAERATSIRNRIVALDSEVASLEPLSGLDIDLSAVGALSSVKVYVGTAKADPAAALARANLALDAQALPKGTAFAMAVAVAARDAPAAEKILSESGFSASPVPAGTTGTPASRLATLAAERSRAQADLEVADADVARLRSEWEAPLSGAEATLMAQVERTQAPLKFGVTQTTFHVEGWVPESRVKSVEEALIARFGDQIYVHDLGDAPVEHVGPEHHKHGEETAEHDAGHNGHHAPQADEEPPIHLENKGLAKPYEFLLGLLGKPRYNEIDPTKLMLLFFPLFFGLMVGDVVVGAVIVVVGVMLKTRKLFGIGGPAVGRALVAGGVMSIIVGALVFGEAMGIHFVTPPATPEHAADMSWESVLGLHIPYSDQPHGLIFKTGTLEQAIAAQENEGGGITLLPHTPAHLSLGGVVNLGIYSKVHDIAALLIWSVLLGLIHIVLGLCLGVRNVYRAHGLKLAFQEKAAWLTLMLGIGALVAGMLAPNAILLGAGAGFTVASVALLWMGAQHTFGAGFIALLEIPGLLGNLLSYTRLAAIGASKAGMVIAISAIAFTIAGGGVVGWIIYVLGFACIIPLAILAGGLQSLRLQFVEFFQKFYVGGGRPYLPFGRRAA
jgi:V/A-type H+-transporting ATPase subunit I